MQAREHWIFYLKLSKNLNEDFFLLDQSFKETNKTLIPINLKNLLECTRNHNSSYHVVIVIKSRSDLKYYDKRIKKILKLLIRSGRVSAYIASSFSSVNDTTVLKRSQYSFVKLPIGLSDFCLSVSNTIDIKESQLHKWPGGIAPKMSIAS